MSEEQIFIPLLEPDRSWTLEGAVLDIGRLRDRATGMGMTNQDEAYTAELPVTFHRDAWSEVKPDDRAGVRWLEALQENHRSGLLPAPELLGTSLYTVSDPSYQARECAMGCARRQSELFMKKEIMTLVAYLEGQFGDIVTLRSNRQQAIRPNEVPKLEGDSTWGWWLLHEDRKYDLPFDVTAIPEVMGALNRNFENAAMRGDVKRTQLWYQAISW